MKYIGLIIISVFFVSCNQIPDLDKYKSQLPDSTIINDVFIQISKIDSFRLDYKISDKIVFPILYKWTKWDKDSVPPPPPPPGGISYDELFLLFGHDSIKEKRYDDSIFIKLQIDTTRKFSISRDLINRYNNESKRFYIFDMPIFSFDKEFVIVRYWRVCGGLCGTCHQVLLKKVNNHWIKVNSWLCGES